MARVLSIVGAVVGLGVISFVLLSQGGMFKWSLITAGALIVGPFGIAVALFNWDWHFTDPAARPLVDKLGRTGTRWYYAIMGGLLVAFGIRSIATGFYAIGVRYFTDIF